MPLVRCFIMQVLKKHIISDEERKSIVQNISAFLENESAVSFAYIYGSFIEDDGFNDIDIAMYIDESIIKKESLFDCQLDMGVKLENKLNSYPVDCRILNIAPLSFRFSVVTKGELIFSRDEKERVSFEVITRSLYFDFKHHTDFFYQKIALGK